MTAHTVEARVDAVLPLTDTITQLVLVPDTYVDYSAGQYLQVLLDDEHFSYSIANAPLGAHKYELHIRHSQENPYNQRLFTHIKDHGTLTLSLPFGQCSIQALAPKKPILFIAGGTGFAPVKAMIEQLLATHDTRPFELIWGARSRSDLYLEAQVLQWQAHVRTFEYCSVLSGESEHTLASCALTRHAEDLSQWQIVLSGPFDMVYSTRDLLVAHGVPKTHLFSDAFSFEQP